MKGVTPVPHMPVGIFSHLSEPANSGCTEKYVCFSCGISYSDKLTIHFLHPISIKIKDNFVCLLIRVCGFSKLRVI